jgi:ABC-type sugar transport system ATPase subunit
MARIELKNLRKEWVGAHAVAGIDLTIEDGAFVAVLGPSGCGKSTTLMMLAGIYQPTSGDITFDGARVNDVEARGRNVGIVFQSYALYPNMSVLENIMFPLRFKKIERAEAEGRAREIASLVRVDGFLDRRPSQLSGGQQQRVACARALASRPEIVFADEPTGNLDSRSGAEILGFLRNSVRELGQTIVMVTHDPVAASYADRVVFLADGRIVDELQGPTADSVLDRMRRFDAKGRTS